MAENSIYQKAVELMNPKDIDHHASDLYLKANQISRMLVETYEYKNNVTTFKSAIEPYDLWYDIPFAYEPWWNDRLEKR